MNVRFSARCSFGQATLMNSTSRLLASSGNQSVSIIGMMPSSSAGKVWYWLGSKPVLPL